LGQITEYKLATDFKFDLIISDDVDASLAFCDYAKSIGKIFYDSPKFIGALNLEQLLGTQL